IHGAQWHDKCKTEERARDEEGIAALANEIAQLPVRIARKVSRHQFSSPTASRNCCSSTEREGTTPATRTPPAIIRPRAEFKSAMLENVSSNSSSPDRSASGNISFTRSDPEAIENR